MVYSQKFIAVVKANGRVLREKDNNTVYLPFNTEYELFFKNLESRDCIVNVSIDGNDVLNNNKIIIKANSTSNLEGFLKNNKVTNKFKFIKKTQKIIEHRGDYVDDGLIRVEYRFAKIKPVTIETTHIHHYDNFFHPFGCQCQACNPIKHNPFIPYYGSPIYTLSESVSSNSGEVKGILKGNQTAYTSCACANQLGNSDNLNNQIHFNSSVNLPVPDLKLDEGITVKGSKSNQKFTEATVDELEESSHVIVIHLKGSLSEDKPIEKPLTVETKVICSTCGVRNKSRNKFCSECGTALF